MTDRPLSRPSPVLALFAAGLLVFLYLVRAILLPFVFSGIVAFVFTPLVRWLRARTGLPRALCATAVLLLLVVLGALAGWVWVPTLNAAVQGAGSALPHSLERMLATVLGHHRLALFGASWSAAQIATSLAHMLHAWLARPDTPVRLVMWSTAGLFELILSVVLLGYFLLDAPRISQGIAWLVPPRHREVLYQAGREFAPLARRYFVGVAVVALYAGVVAEIGLGLVLHLRQAPMVALLTGLLELIPFIGPTSALVITGLIVLGQLPGPWGVVAFAIYAATLRVSIDQFVGPMLLGRAAGLRPVLVIFSFLAGGVIFGVAGAILAVPAALGVKVLLGVIYRAEAVR